MIYFDTGKSVIKSESDKALAEIAKLLKGDVKLEVNIVDHTDRVRLDRSSEKEESYLAVGGWAFWPWEVRLPM